jgi:hypothetical protein
VRESERFVRVMVDGTGGKRRETLSAYRVTGFPTVLLLDPAGREADRVAGMIGADALRERLRTVADRHEAAVRLERHAAALGELGAWISGRVAKLGDPDVEVRARAAAELASLKAALDAALQVAARSRDAETSAQARRIVSPPERPPVVIPVAAHTRAERDGFVVEFECGGADALSFRIVAGSPRRIEVVNADGKVAETDEKGRLPRGFGYPREMRLYRR